MRRATADKRWEWTLSSESRAALSALVNKEVQGLLLVLRVGVVPRWLPGGVKEDSALCFESAFRVLVGNLKIDDFLIDGDFRDNVLIERNVMRGGIIRENRVIGNFFNRR